MSQSVRCNPSTILRIIEIICLLWFLTGSIINKMVNGHKFCFFFHDIVSELSALVTQNDLRRRLQLLLICFSVKSLGFTLGHCISPKWTQWICPTFELLEDNARSNVLQRTTYCKYTHPSEESLWAEQYSLGQSSTTVYHVWYPTDHLPENNYEVSIIS